MIGNLKRVVLVKCHFNDIDKLNEIVKLEAQLEKKKTTQKLRSI